jgi:hypothetical protein
MKTSLLGQQRLAASAGGRTGKAIAEIERCRIAAAFAEIAIGGAGDLGLLARSRFDDDAGLSDGFVEAPLAIVLRAPSTTMAASRVFAADIRFGARAWLAHHGPQIAKP